MPLSPDSSAPRSLAALLTLCLLTGTAGTPGPAVARGASPQADDAADEALPPGPPAAEAGSEAGSESESDAESEAESDAGLEKAESAKATEPADRLLVTAAELHVGDGTVHRPGRLLIRDGRIEAVGADIEAPEDARRWDWPEAVLTPGLVEPAAALPLGSGEQRGSLPNAALTTADAHDPFDPWLERLRAEGIVAVVLHPSGSGTFRGRLAALGTKGPGAGGAPLLTESASLAVSLEADRPGSAARAAARAALEDELEKTEGYVESWKKWRDQEAADAKKSPAEVRREERRIEQKKKGAPSRVKKPGRDEGREVLQAVLERKLPLRVEADRRESVLAALDLARRRGLRLSLIGCLECGELSAELERSRAVVILDPLSLPIVEGPRGEPDGRLVASLDSAGARVAVTGGGAWPAGALWLRIAAADLVRRGLTRERAIAAMTDEAAAAAGLGDSHGRLAPGRAAEFVVWTGDPLSVSARVERVVGPEDCRKESSAEAQAEEDRS